MSSTAALPETVRTSRAYQVLERSLARERLAHGILLHGDNLRALEQVAAAVAAQLLDSSGDPLVHPDCFTLRPQGKARRIKVGAEADKIAGDWPQNSMRRLINDLRKTASLGSRKVGIVFEADRMNPQSANAFLKTLEEPAPGTTLFLLTTRPYDLLPTIRSRCLNFRIPAAADNVGGATWQRWLKDYQSWLAELAPGPRSKAAAADLLFAAYGLNTRFQAVLGQLTAAEWSSHKETLPEGLGDAELAALETGIRKGLRRQLYAGVEKATLAFGREFTHAGKLPVTAIGTAVAALEQSAGLLELNFNDANALELFLLKSLRVWTSLARPGP